jgi:heme/copper-type cytochrome/quinol oxidase subunit 1
LVHGLPLLGALLAFALIVKPLSARPKDVRKQVIAPLLFGLFAALLALMAVAASTVAHVGDAALLGTTFEEGNWLAVVFSGVLAAMGAVTYWAPKWWGRSLSNAATLPLALLAFLGAELAALPLMVAGFADQPGAVFAAVGSGADAIVNFDYGGPSSLWNTLSTAGLALTTLSVLGFIVLATRSFLAGPQVVSDPWNGQTLEWAAASPAPPDNFAVVHIVASAEPALDLRVSERGAR